MLGSDPELFLKNTEGKYISAIGLVGGTKEHPRPVKELGRGFCVQEDNVLLEFNTPPAKRPSNWVDNHTKMLDYLNKTLKDKGLQISIDASAEMPPDQLVDPRALVFGCDPDFNVWTLRPNPRPYSENVFLRSAGGHVHIAFKGSDTEKIALGRALDYFLGTWSVIKDPDDRRKQLYGKAGSIRFKPYGIEYRVLSNFWLSSKDNMATVWELVERALSCHREVPESVVEIIDTNNKERANEMYLQAIGVRPNRKYINTSLNEALASLSSWATVAPSNPDQDVIIEVEQGEHPDGDF